jgi:hypothetical protein
MKFFIPLLMAFLGLCNTPFAAGVYKWTDAQGRVHFSDVPPVDKGAEAQKVDVKKSELTEAQKKELAARQAKEKELLKSASGKPASSSAAQSPESAASGAKQAQGSASCEEAWKKYNESYACFDPYRMVNGRIRPEGFERCVQLPQPERCK